ncbi:MAG: hypothetical protein ACK5LN_02020 [Propioniciclava sp.]
MAGLIRKGFAGVAAGMVGTLAMDVLWYLRYRRSGGTQDPLNWEFGGVEGWDEVSAPGEVGLLVLREIMGEDPPESWAQPTQNAMHWLTGMGWGKVLAITVGAVSWRTGLALGPLAWLTSYVVLPPLGVYRPIQSYPLPILAKDLSAHLVFGVVTAAVVAAWTPGVAGAKNSVKNPSRRGLLR